MIGADYNVRIRDNYTPGGRVSASDLNNIARLINGMHGRDGITVRIERTGIVISGKPSSSEFNLYAFQIFTTHTNKEPLPANQRRIGDGYMEGRYGYRTITGAIVTCGGSFSNKHLIIAEGDEHGGAVLNNSISEDSFTGDTATKWRRALFRIYLFENSVVVDRVCAGAWGIVL